MGHTIKDLPASGDYLKGGDFPADLSVNLTIETVELKAFDDGAKFLLGFVDGPEDDFVGKLLVLNKTNSKILFANLAPNTDQWIGREIIVRTTPTQKGQGFVVIVPTTSTAAPAPATEEQPEQGEW
jgi:hypothetical protein